MTKANAPGQAWCSQHGAHPDDCFELHRPDVKQVRGSESAEQLAARIAKEHVDLQRITGTPEARGFVKLLRWMTPGRR